MKKTKLQKKKRTLTPEERAKIENIAKAVAGKAKTYYLALIADVAFSLQDELFDKYIGSKTYNKNYRLKMILDGYKKVSDEHYEWFSSLACDKQLYTDLRDGANEHLMPILKKVRKAYREAFRDAGCTHNSMVALAASIVCMVKSVNDTEQWLRDTIKQLIGCSLPKNEKYVMRFEHNYASWILDTYGKNYSDAHKADISVLLGQLVSALMPESLLPEAVKYARQYQPENIIRTFKKDMNNIFQIKW